MRAGLENVLNPTLLEWNEFLLYPRRKWYHIFSGHNEIPIYLSNVSKRIYQTKTDLLCSHSTSSR